MKGLITLTTFAKEGEGEKKGNTQTTGGSIKHPAQPP